MHHVVSDDFLTKLLCTGERIASVSLGLSTKLWTDDVRDDKDTGKNQRTTVCLVVSGVPKLLSVFLPDGTMMVRPITPLARTFFDIRAIAEAQQSLVLNTCNKIQFMFIALYIYGSVVLEYWYI